MRETVSTRGNGWSPYGHRSAGETDDWTSAFKFDPIPALLSSRSHAVVVLANRDLFRRETEPTKSLWELEEVKSAVSRQQPNGSWKYPGGGSTKIRSREDYNQIETFRILAILVEKYAMNREHPAISRAAEYVFSCQTVAGDFRGILSNQYAPYYSAALMELLIKAGYHSDRRIDRGFRWLLSMRQNDGGWALPLRTLRNKLSVDVMRSPTIEPERSKPFSHLITGMVLRAFAAHEDYRKSEEARAAGRLLASRLFKRDPYPDRGSVEYWTKFSFPFWFTDLLSSLDSLSYLGASKDNPAIVRALEWFESQQRRTGGWRLHLVRGKSSRNLDEYIGLAICRVFKRFYD